MAKSSATTYATDAPKTPETWKAFFNMGVLFPLHLVLGISCFPIIVYYLLTGSVKMWIATLIYLPFYLYPAQNHYPGWKGNEGLWNAMDYANTGKSYFGDFSIHGQENVDSDKQYIVACHPHGTVIFQRTFWRSKLCDDLFKKPWRMLGATVLFYIPIVREMTLWFGAVDAKKENCERILRAGTSLVLYPGGLDEANIVDLKNDVRLRTRTGFIRLAIKHNTPVLPVFTFGELECVTAINALPSFLTRWVRSKFRMSTTVFLGRYCTFIPYRVPFNMVFGKEIAVKHCPEEGPAADKEVARVHQEYKAELSRIYESNREKFGYGARKLIFTCEQLETEAAAKMANKANAKKLE